MTQLRNKKANKYIRRSKVVNNKTGEKLYGYLLLEPDGKEYFYADDDFTLDEVRAKRNNFYDPA